MAFWAVPNRTRAVEGENGIELYGDFQADEVSDLADTLDGVTIAAGSVAQIIKTTEPTFVTLGTDGTWYPEQSDSRASTLSAPQLSLTPNIRGSVNLTAQPQEETEVPEAEPEVEETAEPEGGAEERARNDDFAEF